MQIGRSMILLLLAVPSVQAQQLSLEQTLFSANPESSRSAHGITTSEDTDRWRFQRELELDFRLPFEGTAADDYSPISLAADFDTQEAIMVCCNDSFEDFAPVFLDIVRYARGHTKVVAVVSSEEILFEVARTLRVQPFPCDHVWFVVTPLNTFWVRDFGPLMGKSLAGRRAILDFQYADNRRDDDALPKTWSQLTGDAIRELPVYLEGGNLLSNGNGLAITTTKFLVDNQGRFESDHAAIQWLEEQLGLDQLVVLRPLEREETEHADMFATFTDPYTVIIGRLDGRHDLVNSRILDENAEVLRGVKIGNRSLKVVRLDISPQQNGVWCPYTNAIFANKLILVPTFEHDSWTRLQAAIKVFEKLKPSAAIHVIRTDTINQYGGALHCAYMSMPELVLPKCAIPARDIVNLIEVVDAVESDPQQERGLNATSLQL